VAGGVDRDDQKTQPGGPAEHSQISAAVQPKAMQEHQRHTLATD